MIFAMYLVVAEQQGADWKTLSGTIQNDILKEFIAQKEYIFPPRPSMRLITDIFAFCAQRSAEVEHDLGQRLSHPRSRRDRGCRSWRSRCATASSTCSGASTPGSTSTTSCRGISFFFNAHSDFFEEIAKYRAARKHLGATRCATASARRTSARGSCASTRQTAGVLADRAAAVQQRRPHGAAGAVGGARRHQLAAHQLARRGAGAADRGGGDARAAHAADHRARERRRPTSSIRSAARTSSRQLTRDMEDGALRLLRARSTAWAAWSRRSSAASRSGDRRERRTGSSRRSSAARRSSSASTTSCRTTSRRSRSSTSTRAAADTQLARARASCAQTRDNDAVRRALDALRRRARGTRQH